MKILLLSPHTDDVELGAGGSVIKFLEEGNKILWVVFSTAEDSVPKVMPKDILKKEFLSAIKFLKTINPITCKILNYKVRQLSYHRQEILESLISIRKKFNPDLVIGPSLNDFHQDHQTVAIEMVRAFKTTSKIICYELPWNHINFETKVFVKLKEPHIKMKYELLKRYKSQYIKARPYFSYEYICGLAKVRGVQCNSKYAEAFEVIRWMM